MSISRRWMRDVLLHQIDEVGAAGDEFRRRVLRDLADGVTDVPRLDIVEVDHDEDPGEAPCMTSSMAATMFG